MRTSIFLLILFFASTYTFAQETISKNTEQRKNKTIVTTVGLLTGYFDGGFTSAFKLGYYLNKNNVLEYENLSTLSIISHETSMRYDTKC